MLWRDTESEGWAPNMHGHCLGTVLPTAGSIHFRSTWLAEVCQEVQALGDQCTWAPF